MLRDERWQMDRRGDGSDKKKDEEGSLTGPMMVACHWKSESPEGPAEQDDGGSLPKSSNSSEETVSRSRGRAKGTHC